MGRIARGQIIWRDGAGKWRQGSPAVGEQEFFLRCRARGADPRRIPLGLCEFAEARRRGYLLVGYADGAGSGNEWLAKIGELAQVAEARSGAAVGAAGELELGAAWRIYLERGEMSREKRTLQSVKGRWMRFVTWAVAKGVETVGAIDRVVALEYARDVGAAKVSAVRDLNTLRNVWEAVGGGDVWEGVKPGRARVKSERARRFRRLDGEELQRIVAVAEGELRCAIVIAYWTALRLKDVLGLRREYLVDGGTVLEVVPGKTEWSKQVPLRIPVSVELAEMLAGLPAEGALLPGLKKRGGGLVSKDMTALLRSVGVENDRRGTAGFHSLRTTFISLMDEAGVPPHVTDSLTGHARQGMHGRYSQPGMAAKREAIERALGRLLKPPSLRGLAW